MSSSPVKKIDLSGTSVKLSTLMELLFPIIVVLYPILAIINGEFYGRSFLEFMGLYTVSFFVGIPFLAITYSKLGSRDIRFQMVVHILILAISVVIVTSLIANIGIYDLYDPNRELTLFEILVSYIVVNGPLLLVVIGALLNTFDLMTPFEQEIEEISGGINRGDLSHRIENDDILSDTILGKSANLINNMISGTASLVSNIAMNVENIAASTEEVASSTEEVNAAIEEVNSTSQSMSQGANQQAEMISRIVEEMTVANEVILDIIEKVQENTNMATEIAEETKYLALNARIEAARAGASGRGFAVVAEDVRNLSEQSNMAAGEISEIVDSISQTLKNLFDKISNQIEHVASVSEETAASAEELTAVAEEVTASIESISYTTQELSDEAQNTSSALSVYKVH